MKKFSTQDNRGPTNWACKNHPECKLHWGEPFSVRHTPVPSFSLLLAHSDAYLLLQIQAAPKRLDHKFQCTIRCSPPGKQVGQAGFLLLVGFSGSGGSDVPYVWRTSEQAAKRTVKSSCPQTPNPGETARWPRLLMKAKVWDGLVTSKGEPLQAATLLLFLNSMRKA